MSRRTNNMLVAVVLIATLTSSTLAKSIGDPHQKSKKSLGLGGEGNAPTADVAGLLNRLVHKKAAFLDATNPAVNALNPELFGDVSAPSGPASPWGGADQAFRMPNLDDQFIDSELEHEDDSFQGGQRAEVLALIEAALKQGLPWDYYLSLAAKRSGSTLGALGYEDIMNQPRSLTRETRDDGRRYLMWRKITG